MYPITVTELPLISVRPFNKGQAIVGWEAREVADLRAQLQDPAKTVAENGVLYWRIAHRDGSFEHRVIPPHVLTDAFIAIWPAQTAAYDVYVTGIVADMRKNAAPLSGENLAEARAAHGPGVKLVNIFTGVETWT